MLVKISMKSNLAKYGRKKSRWNYDDEETSA